MSKLQDGLVLAVEKGQAVTVVEPPSGLTDEEREAIRLAIGLKYEGRHEEAQAALLPHGMRFEAHVVQQGKLVPLDQE